MKLRNYTKEQFIEAVKTSTSIRQVLHKLNIKEAGGNYMTAKTLIKEASIDTSHFIPYTQINKGKKFGPKRPLEDYLSNKYKIISYRLKNRLIQENIFTHQCSNCKLEQWLGNPIPLELHHHDGNHINNNIDNISLLCPNCHTLTDNYRGKKLKRPLKEKVKYIRKKKPCICGREKNERSKVCIECYKQQRA